MLWTIKLRLEKETRCSCRTPETDHRQVAALSIFHIIWYLCSGKFMKNDFTKLIARLTAAELLK